MSYGPWGLIATYFNALGSNISESDKSRKEGEQQSNANQLQGYQYGSAPQLDQSNFDAGSPSTTGSNLIGDFGKGFGGKLFAGAIQGEKDMMSPQVNVQGAAAIQPTHVDSSQSPYNNSGLAAFSQSPSPLAQFSRDYYLRYGR